MVQQLKNYKQVEGKHLPLTSVPIYPVFILPQQWVQQLLVSSRNVYAYKSKDMHFIMHFHLFHSQAIFIEQ